MFKSQRKRKISLSGLRDKAWKYFSEYVRRKDADQDGYVRCFTCGKGDHWKNLDAGHYIAKSVSLYLRFNESNVKPQCTACNRFRHGNLTQYALRLQEFYGPAILEDLDADRRIPTKYSRSDYEEKISTYKQKLKDLDGG